MSQSDNNIEKLEAFQYRPFVKRVHILLPGFKYLHTTSTENSGTMVGRKRTEQQLLSFLQKGGSKGSYLITGYRGMGKTTLVNNVLNKYIKEKEKERKKISISFGQKNITELDILKQIVSEIKVTYETSQKITLDRYRALNSYLQIKFGVLAFFILIFSSLLLFLYFITQNKGFGELKIEDLDFKSDLMIPLTALYLIISVCASFWITTTKKHNLNKNEPKRKIINNYESIVHLYDRCTSQYTSEESAGTGSENLPILLSRKKSRSYALAGAKEISNELIKIIGHSSMEFIFIFDELDKIDTNSQQALYYEDTQIQDLKGETFSFDDHRKRKKLILDILSSLKYLTTEAKAKFIFIAGSEMFDAALADVSDRHSAISSIFGHIINVDSLYKDKAEEGSIGVGITNLVEHFLSNLVYPGHNSKELDSILKMHWFGAQELTKDDELKIMYTLQHFVNYLAYRSTGSPKKLIKIIEEHTKTFSGIPNDSEVDSKFHNKHKNIFATADPKCKDKILKTDSDIYLSLSYYDQYKFGLLNYFYRPIIISKSRVMKNYSDSLLVSIPYLMDHIHKFNGNAFSIESLELLPEVLSSGHNPELRMFMEDLIEQFKQTLIRGTETKFFDYKFNFKIYSEIVHVSTLFAEESSAYNFTLDENYNIKLYLRLKIKELRLIYKDFGGDQNGNAQDSIALYNTLLGDVTYYDREYSDAIGCYLDALNAMQNDDVKDEKQLSLNGFHGFSYLKCMMKLALCYEKIKSYEKAIACYIDVINVVGKIATVESKYFLREETNRYQINALFSCLFIYEKQPSLGGFNRLFNHVMDIDKVSEEPEFISNSNPESVKKYRIKLSSEDAKTELDRIISLRFREFLMKEPSFLHHLGQLLFYRNTPDKDDSVVQKILKMAVGHPGIPNGNNNVKYPDRLAIACTNSLLLKKFENIEKRNQTETANEKTNLQNIIDHLKTSYEKKTLAPEEAFFAARSLSRLGNLYYSSYLSVKKDSEQEDVNRDHQLKDDVTDLIKVTLKDEEGTRGISLKDCTSDQKNASDMIKQWLNNLNAPKFNSNGFLEKITLSDIVYIYLLAGKLYMYSSHSLMGSHLYRKIMAILRNSAAAFAALAINKDEHGNYTDRADIELFIAILKKTIIRRCLQIASWNSSSTDRSQVYKYKHALGIEYIFHDKAIAKHNYKNVSNAPDVKEAIWHLIALTEICGLNGEYKPADMVENNPNQSFICQSSTIHTMYSRLNELDIQCVINKTSLKALWANSDTEIRIIYKELRKLEDYSIKNSLEAAAETLGQDQKNINQLPYLVANWIFCLHSMIQIIQTKGASYLFTFSTLADQYRRLGDVLRYYEFCKYLYKQGKVTANVFDLTQAMVGKDVIKSMDSTSLYQMATRNYRAAISAHTKGASYRYLISNMYFLEDDFHDNMFHFSISFERHRINSGEIMHKLRGLNDEMANSQFFDFDTHINSDNEWNNLFKDFEIDP